MIHIGWQKTGSTLLQREIRRQLPANQAVNLAVFALHNPILAVAKGESAGLDPELRGKLRQAVAAVGQAPIAVSDERISQWRGTHARRVLSGGEVRVYQRIWADLLVEHLPDEHVLMVRRHPATWLRSQYAQDVKCGASYCYLPFAEWCEANAGFLLAATDIVGLHGLYTERFGPERVTVLNYEALSSAPDAVARLFESRFGLPLSHDFFHERSNSSLPPEVNERLRQVQLLIELMANDLDVPANRSQGLRDQLFWFINHAAVNKPEFGTYMKGRFRERLAEAMPSAAIPAAAAEDVPPRVMEVLLENHKGGDSLMPAGGVHS